MKNFSIKCKLTELKEELAFTSVVPSCKNPKVGVDLQNIVKAEVMVCRGPLHFNLHSFSKSVGNSAF